MTRRSIILTQTDHNDPASPLSFVVTGRGTPLIKTLPSDIQPEEDETNLRWFLEKHARDDPFERERAKKTTLYLHRLSAKLKEIVLDDFYLTESVRIIVRGNGKKDSKFHAIHWELLELQQAANHRIIVARTVKAEPQLSNAIYGNASGFDLCLLAARKVAEDGEESADYEHRLVSQPLADALENSPVDLHIIRPGTFEALKQHLRWSKERGQPVNLVHLDVHGVVVRQRDGELKAHLEFMNSKFGLDRVEVAEVGKLFAQFGVKVVILNACESARSSANMAEVLIQHGVQFVFAMSYRIMTSAVATMMSRFYASFLQENNDCWTAASDARQALRETKSRQARFGLDVDVDDWIVPVAYGMNDQELHIKWKSGQVPASKSPFGSHLRLSKRTALPQQISVPVGREALIYKIESTLLLTANSLILHGQSGWGKTHLARYLSQWWSRTGFTSKQCIIDMGDCKKSHPLRVCQELIASLDAPIQGTVDKRHSKVGSLSRGLAMLKIRRTSSVATETFEEIRIRLKTLLSSLADPHRKGTWTLIILDGLNVPDDPESKSKWKPLLELFQGLPCFVLVFCREPFMAREYATLISLPRLTVYSCHQLQRKLAAAGEPFANFATPRSVDDENSRAAEKLFERLDFLPGCIEIMSLQSRSTTIFNIERSFTMGEGICLNGSTISLLKDSNLYKACKAVFNDSNTFEKSILLGLSLFDTFPRDLDGFATRLLKYECLDVPLPSRDWTPSMARRAVLELNLDIFAAITVFGGRFQKSISYFTRELREAGLLYLGGFYKENETVTLTWKIHPLFTLYLRTTFHNLKIEERRRYHEAFVDYHDWRTTLPPLPTADVYEPSALSMIMRTSQAEVPLSLQVSNVINLEKEITAGVSNFLSALDISLDWITHGIKSPSITAKVPLQILHAIQTFDGGLVILTSTNAVDSIAEYTSRAIEAFTEYRPDGHIYCPKEKLDYGVSDRVPNSASQSHVLKSLVHYSEWLCRFYLMRDPTKLNDQIRVTRDLVADMERKFQGLQDMSECAEELSKFETFAMDPQGNAMILSTLFQGAPSGPETLPLKVARLLQELGAPTTEFQMKLQSSTYTTPIEVEDALRRMDLEVLRVTREIAPLWPEFLSLAKEKPEMVAMFRMCGIRLQSSSENQQDDEDDDDDSDNNSMDELFGSDDDSLTSTLKQSMENFLDIIEKISEGDSDDEILASMSTKNQTLLKSFLNKDMLIDGLETQTGSALGVEMFHSLLIQQFMARKDWSGLLEFLDSLWIQERSTPQDKLSVEKLLLVGRWHLLRGVSQLHLLRIHASYEECLKTYNISTKRSSISMSHLQFQALLRLAGFKKDGNMGEMPGWDIMFRIGILVYHPDHKYFFTRDGKVFTDIFEIVHERILADIRGVLMIKNMMVMAGILPNSPQALRIYDRLESLAKDPVARAQSPDFSGSRDFLETVLDPMIIPLAAHLDQETRNLVRADTEAAIEHLQFEYDSACWLMGKMMEESQPLTIRWYENQLRAALQVVWAKYPGDVALINKVKQFLRDSQEKFIPEAEWAQEHGEKSPRIQQLVTDVEHVIFLKEQGKGR